MNKYINYILRGIIAIWFLSGIIISGYIIIHGWWNKYDYGDAVFWDWLAKHPPLNYILIIPIGFGWIFDFIVGFVIGLGIWISIWFYSIGAFIGLISFPFIGKFYFPSACDIWNIFDIDD